MNMNEKKALYAFGCPNREATVKRLRMAAALSPDPATKKLFRTLAVKPLSCSMRAKIRQVSTLLMPD